MGLKNLKNIFLWSAIVGALTWGWLQLPGEFWQYLFFLRIPLLMGALLLALPAIAEFFLPSVLKNLFVLRSKWQMATTILGATVAGVAVTFVTKIIIHNAPARFGIEPLLTLAPPWSYLLIITLALPTIIAVADLSQKEICQKKEEEKDKEWQKGLFLGASLSAIFCLCLKLLGDLLHHNSDNFLVVKINGFLAQLISFLAKSPFPQGYIDTDNNLTQDHIDAFVFFIALLAVYIAIFFLKKPTPLPSQNKREAPALLYVNLLISIATLFLGHLTFFFDYWRISALLFWLVIAALAYGLFNVEHFFLLKADPHQTSEKTDFATLLQKRLDKQQQSSAKDTLVVICASGGGIQAAGWTVQVLTGLQECLGESFTKSIGLISSVSGGSVGAMYYLDRFTNQGFPSPSSSEEIFNSATADSLDAVGWGLAYPDLWRLIALPFLPGLIPVTRQIKDRGFAIETDWQGEMKTPDTPKTLADWRQELDEGNIPLPVFNSTIVEDGSRLLISPVDFPDSPKVDCPHSSKRKSFYSLYGQKTIDVVTAARLSATFPYVSPICRGYKSEQKYHIADGGYFDNSGFVTALEWLKDHILPKQSHLKRVLILQINPFPKATSLEKNNHKQGLFMATLGPLLTLFKVRDSILYSRNTAEVELLEKWQQVSKSCQEQEIDIKHVPIFFPSLKELKDCQEIEPGVFYNKLGEYRPPLSWKLTGTEKEAIQKAWRCISGKIVDEIKPYWQEE